LAVAVLFSVALRLEAVELQCDPQPAAAVTINLAHLPAVNDLPVQAALPDPLVLAD
jgi:hypothetical protein